jgi:hypothetical protein
MGEGTQARLASMGERSGPTFQSVRVARWLFKLFVSFSNVKTVMNYIARQEEHHERVSFQDELRALLRRHEIKFDERYLWD